MAYFKRCAAVVLCVALYIGAVSCTSVENGDDSFEAETSVFSSLAESVSIGDASSSSSIDEDGSSAASVDESSISMETEDATNDASSEDVPSSEEPSMEAPPSSEPDSSIVDDVSSAESTETSVDAPENSSEEEVITGDFDLVGPNLKLTKAWSKSGMELYNTDFRLSDALVQKFAARFSSFSHAQSVVLISMDTDMVFCYSKDTKIATASSIKGPMALFTYRCIDNGDLSWDTVLTYKPYHFQKDSTGLVQHSPFGTEFTMKTLMDYMVRISDNQAYLMIKERVGAENFEKMIAALGGTRVVPKGSNWGNITGLEMARVWREIYYYSKSCDSGAELLDRFMHAQYNYIWRAIPQYEAAHKSGWSGKAFNDAGIVYADGHEYVIAVLMGRNGVKDSSSQFQFNFVTQLLAELMVEYNAYLDGGGTDAPAADESTGGLDSSAEESVYVEDSSESADSIEISENGDSSDASESTDSADVAESSESADSEDSDASSESTDSADIAESSESTESAHSADSAESLE